MQFKIHTESDGDTLKIVLAGELELSTAADFRDVVQEAEAAGKDVEIDLRDVLFMDSTGLQVLLQCHLRAHEQGRQVTLLRPSEPVLRLLALTGLEREFTIRD